MPSFIRTRGVRPDREDTVELWVENLSCRGRANLLFYFLERDDMFRIPGYFKLEAWPDPNTAYVRITYDATVGNEDMIKRAITEPYFDAAADFWRSSPFRIEGYDPLDFDIREIEELLGP
jgi:hypothetical protein